MSGDIEFGKCPVCGEKKQLLRTTYYYGIKCECHSPEHFEIAWHCKDCVPKEPKETKVSFLTEKLKQTVMIDTDQFEHLLNCMCNQKFIHEQSAKTQKEWQEIIDKAYHEARGLLSKPDSDKI